MAADDNSANSRMQALKREGNQCFVVQKNYPKAIQKYTEALEVETGASEQEGLAEERAKLFANRAECKIRLGKFEEAVEDCEQALSLQPRYVKASYRKAKCLDELGKTQEAVEILKHSLKYEKNNDSERLLANYQAKLRQQDSTVPKSDAIKIANFSNLNSRKKLLEAKLKKVQLEMEEISDAKEELEVAIDDDCALLMVGDVFIPTTEDDATEYAEKREEELTQQIEQIQQQINVVLDQMSGLKEELKSRFGENINLEE